MFMFKQEKWRLHEQALLLRRLGELLEKGYSLLHALEFLHFHLTPSKQIQLQDAAEEFKKGSSLHDVFYKLAFHPDILSYLFYAEQHGDIAFALQKGSSLLGRKDKHQKNMMKVLRYPFVLSLFLLGILLVFNLVLLPQFSTLYRSLHGSSTSFTDNILTVIQALPYVMGGVVFAIGTLALIYMLYVKRLHPVTRMDICMRVPLIKMFFKLTNSHYFAIQLSGLLQGGLSILEALTLMKEQKHHLFFQCEALKIQELLTIGEHLDSIMMNRSYYEQELAYIIKHGQANGNLATELADYSEMTIEKIEEKINRVLFVIQPLLFACIGMVVVLMYLAMIMPMFQMMNSI
ncbi:MULTISPECIES: competence type IV pilus assembly protein ComGB [unclassified Bacillus (in: firmicutes)]|uniref:competence type IV pilus assembly protein ComGB n=1 Tax=unclassified Bacillus (in: firmicutes) TaxID=185979 RepID=UPI00244EFBB2|nr:MULTISPECIES: competence type IV pilus assembly protein ComGB [unclassified Bacillus (in: firmicutes)]